MVAILKRFRWGEPITVVSGLPRSGTSMMMRMLSAGGLKVLSDGEREADVDNPHGYFELDRIMHLEKETDKSYLREARGRVVKVISFLLKDLPDDNFYRVVFMRRPIEEVLASQNKMIARLGSEDSTDDATMKESYMNDIARVRVITKRRSNFELMEVAYGETLSDPLAMARRVREFVGHALDERAMAGAVDPTLYRNRLDKLG